MADIRKRTGPSGTSYQVRYPTPSTKSGYAWKTLKTRKEAVAFVESLGGMTHPSREGTLTVPEAIDRWLRACERTGRNGREKVEPTTLAEYQRRALVMKEYEFGKPLHELRPTDVANFRQWLLEHKTRDLARRTLSSFHSVIIEMRQLGYIKDDPAHGITVRNDGRYDDDRQEVAIPSDSEVKSMLAAMDRLANKNKQFAKAWDRYKPMICLALFTGMRPSEYRGLTWDTVEVNRIHVRQRADIHGTIGPVKSRAGRRTIYIPSALSEMLANWRKKCPKSAYNLVFPTSSGKPMPLNNFTRRAWVPMILEAGLVIERNVGGKVEYVPKYSPYALRHYFASKLIAKGKDLKFIQTSMGHADIQMTLNVYGHLLKDRDSEHIDTAEEMANELSLA